MKKKVIEIINKYPMKEYGFCRYEDLSDRLLSCASRRRLPDGAETVLVFLFPYFLGEEVYRNSNISRYAVVPDYHEVVGTLLDQLSKDLKEAFPQNVFEPFVDNSPIPEVLAAAKAGLGVIGKNHLLLNPRYGSFVFIGEIVTTLPLSCDAHEISQCIGCEKCLHACPNGQCSVNQCLSAITQKKKELTEQEVKLIRENGSAWGCDICQLACPYNREIEPTNLEMFQQHSIPVLKFESPLEGRAYAWRGKKVVERNLRILSEKQ